MKKQVVPHLKRVDKFKFLKKVLKLKKIKRLCNKGKNEKIGIQLLKVDKAFSVFKTVLK